MVVKGKTLQGVSCTTVQPGQAVSWRACKGSIAVNGTLIYTAFKIKGTSKVIFLGNECPMIGAAKAYSEIYEDKQISEGIGSLHSTYESNAHSSHQKSTDGYL